MNANHPKISEICIRADDLYAGRSTIANVIESVRVLKTVKRLDAYEVQWRLSRAHFFLGQEETDPAEKIVQHESGISAGRTAVQNAPDQVEGHFWLGVNLALRAGVASTWRAVRLALRAKYHLRRAVAIDPGYHGAGPHRVLARLLQHLPRLLGGWAASARDHFEFAVRLAPTNTVTRIYFAEFLLKQNLTAQAFQHLQAVIDAPTDPAWEFEQTRDRAFAISQIRAVKR